jgi:hypothetical protein
VFAEPPFKNVLMNDKHLPKIWQPNILSSLPIIRKVHFQVTYEGLSMSLSIINMKYMNIFLFGFGQCVCISTKVGSIVFRQSCQF